MKYQTFDPLPPHLYESLKADIAMRGVRVPVEVDENGDILCGHNRVQICQELGRTDYPVNPILGLSEEEKVIYARKDNFLRRHMTREQLAVEIEKSIKAAPTWSDRRHAENIGVDHKTIGAARARLEVSGEIPHIEIRTDLRERSYAVRPPVTIQAKNPDQAKTAVEQLGNTTLTDGGEPVTLTAGEIFHSASKTLYATNANRETERAAGALLRACEELISKATKTDDRYHSEWYEIPVSDFDTFREAVEAEKRNQ